MASVGAASVTTGVVVFLIGLGTSAGAPQKFPASCTNVAWTDGLPYSAGFGGQNLLRLHLQSEGGKYTAQSCQQECIELGKFLCVAYAILSGTYSTENYCLMFAEPAGASSAIVFTTYSIRTYIRPVSCLPSGGCRSDGEYLANYSNRCKFYRCTQNGNTLQAQAQDCPPGTTTSLNFTRYTDGSVVTPCYVAQEQDCVNWKAARAN